MLQKIEFHAMGCEMLALLDTEAPAHVLERVPVWFDRWEKIFSRFLIDSELSRVNRSEGMPVRVSPEFAKVFELSRSVEEKSGGLVTPLIYNAVVQAGYDHDFARIAEMQAVSHPEFYAELPSIYDIGWYPEERIIILPPQARLDFGGIVKGWAAFQAAKMLKEVGPILIDAAGDIAISGKHPGAEDWIIGVADPFHHPDNLELLRLGACGVATSGKDRRRWRQNGRWSHHIIDPHTGIAAKTDVMTATVVAPTSDQAEWAAKTSFLLGADDGLNWLNARPELAGILVLDDGQRLYSQRMENYLWR